MSIIQIQREIDAAFRHGDVDEYHRLLDVMAKARKAKAAIIRGGIERRSGIARGFTVAKRGIVR